MTKLKYNTPMKPLHLFIISAFLFNLKAANIDYIKPILVFIFAG